MDEFLFIEVDEEITSIIERLHEISSKHIGLVVPRGATIMQSVVNLKLIKSEAKKNGKTVAVVTQDKIGRNLAAQIGLTVYDDTKQATASTMPVVPMPGTDDVIEIDMSDKKKADATEEIPEGVKVHYYADNEDESNPEEGEKTAAAEESEEEAKEELINHEPMPAPSPESLDKSEKSDRKGIEKTEHNDKLDDNKVTAPTHHYEDSEKGEGHKSNMTLNTKPVEEKKEMPKSLQGDTKAPLTPKAKKLRKWKIGIGITVAVLAVVALWITLTKATVNIVIPSETFEVEKEITVDGTLVGSEPANGKIKGTVVEVEEEMKETYDATGEKTTGETASGELTFYNDLGVDQTLAAGTTVTSSGYGFTTTASITIPKATLDSNGNKVKGSVKGSVKAKAAGAEYNMSSGTVYSVSGNEKLSASGATSGGTTVKITILSQNDLDKAKDRLSADAPSLLRDKIVEQVQGQYYLDKTISYEVTEFTSTSKVNDETEQFEVTAKVKASVMTYSEDDVRATMQELAKADIPEGQSILTNDDDVINQTLVSNDTAKKEMIIKAKLSTHVGQAIDTKALIDKIKGKSVKDARQIISQETNSIESTVTIKPNTGLLKLPWIKSNIKIDLSYQTTNENTGSDTTDTDGTTTDENTGN